MTRMDAITGAEAERRLDDWLVAAVQAGDRAAFDRLARRWHARLSAHAWRLTGDREAARDAAQAAWVEIARGVGRLRDPRAFPAWAYRIVTRRCARAVGRLQADRDLVRAVAREPLVTTDEAPDAGPDLGRLDRAIRALPPGQRAALALFHFEELSVAETAVALDIPAGTVKTRLMHARRALRAALEGDD